MTVTEMETETEAEHGGSCKDKKCEVQAAGVVESEAPAAGCTIVYAEARLDTAQSTLPTLGCRQSSRRRVATAWSDWSIGRTENLGKGWNPTALGRAGVGGRNGWWEWE